ncbi:MAG: substrate-binding domain-containing protein [Christensenella sp.]|nr:substrate-binding domain-containing protein [Christensenella sp.]
MKKLIAVLMVLASVLALAACAAPAATTPAAAEPAAEAAAPAEPAAATEAPAAKTITVGVSLYARDQFISTLEQGILAAAEAAGVTVDSQEANNDTQKQAEQVRTFAAKGYDVLIVNLVDTSTAETIISEAGGIPIIFVNRRPDDSILVTGKYAYVGSQEWDAGKMQAEFLAKYFAGRTDPINYVLFMGQLGLENTQQRTESVKTELTNAGFTLNKVFEDTAKWDRATAMDMMQTFLGTGAEFDCVICNNDEMALGVIEALKAGGVDLTKVPVVGIDATDMACESVKNGEMAMTVFQDAAGQGAKCIEFAKLAAEGKLTEQFGWVPFQPVTKDNVADFIK